MFLVKAQPCSGDIACSRPARRDDNVAQRLQHITALFRKMIRHLHHLPPSVSEAVGCRGSTPSTFGELRDNASLIWIGLAAARARLLQHLGEVLAGMLPSGKNSAMVHAPTIDTIAAGDVPSACRRFACQAQNPHARVVVVHHAALRRLPDQLLQRRRIRSAAAALDPLGRRRQRHSTLFLEPFHRWNGTLSRTQQGDHRHAVSSYFTDPPLRLVVGRPARSIAYQPLHFDTVASNGRAPQTSPALPALSTITFPGGTLGKGRRNGGGVWAGHPAAPAKRSGAGAPMTGRIDWPVSGFSAAASCGRTHGLFP